MSAIELKDITFSYDNETNIFEDASLNIEYGEVTLVSGHSGDGKSTLMYIISGVIPNVTEGHLKGKVYVDGEDIEGKKLGHISRKVGIVLQNADSQIVYKNVEDEIAFGCENLNFAPERIEKQIDTVCKLMKLNKKDETRTLSGGQKQRLITASTLAMGQKIIILDEPLANLDKDGARLLMTTLRSLAKAGYAVIVIEHRLDMVLPYVDKVFHVGDKKIVEIHDKDTYLNQQTKKIEDICPPYEEKGNIFSLKNVSFSVKKKEILKDITFDVPNEGRIVLLGENGCGKTTLMRLVARLYKPDNGQIEQFISDKFKGKRGSKKWYKTVGVVYQNPDYQLFMNTVEKEIKFSAESDEYAEKIIDLFKLRHLIARHPQSLSEGQKRRVSIAAVLSSNPKVLLLDEPTVGQDYEGLKDMVNILNDIHNETHNTMITVTHDVRCAESLCDKAFLIENGTVSKSGGKEIVREYFGK